MRAFILFITIFISVNSLKGQKPYNYSFADPIQDKYRWQHCKELSGKNFTCFCEQTNGTMWFGIESGIMSYNGYKWTEYLIPKEKRGIEQIWTMVFLGDTLFAGGECGIQTFVNGVWSNPKFFGKKPAYFDDMQGNGRIIFRTLIKSNDVILGQSSFGLYIRKNGQDHYYTSPEIVKRWDTISTVINFHTLAPFGKGVNYFFTSVLDAGNNTYYGFLSHPYNDLLSTSASFKHYFKFKLTNDITNPLELIEDNIEGTLNLGGPTASVIRPNGEIWVVSEINQYGLNILRNNKWKYFSYKENLNDSEGSGSILNLSDGSLLITSLAVIYRYYNNQWSKISAPDIPFRSSRIRSFYTKSGDLWMGDHKGEVYKIDYSSKHWTIYKGLNYQFTNTDSSLWFISDDNKVVFKKDNSWSVYDQSNGLPSYLQTLFLTKNGTIWCGGSHKRSSATAFLKNSKWIMQVHDSLSWGINYKAVAEDNNGDIWFGGAAFPRNQYGQKGGGIKIHQDNNDVQITWFYKDNDPKLFSFIFGDKNTLYAGTNLGLYTLEKNQLKNVLLDRIFCNRVIRASKGHIWIATQGKGVVKFADDRDTAFTVEQGLASNTTYDIYAVNDTSIWVATNEGYSYLNGHYWLNDLYPHEFDIEPERGKLTGDGNNIWISKFPVKWIQSALDDSKYKGSKNDFFSVMYKRDTMPPETEIKLFFEKVASTGNTNIEWTGIDYMNHTNKQELIYSFRLNNQAWSEPNSKSNINLNGLRSGDYVFEVKAFDKDMNQDMSPANVQFSVAPPVWQEAWFVIMVVSFVSTIIFLIIRIIRRNNVLALLNQNLEESQSEISQQNEELETTINMLKETQSQLVQSEKMASIGILTAGVSHELNNPLNFIQGGKTAIEDYINDNIKEHSGKLLPFIDIIETGINRASQIVQSLNRLSRTGDSKTDNCNIHSIIDNCLIMLHSQTKNKVEIIKQFTDVPFLFKGNEGKMHQAFINVLTNAVQAIEEQGTILIVTDVDINYITIQIKDSGSGISNENLKKVMDPFFTTKDPGKGIGLGLSIVYNIVKEHNGSISFESELAKGTTVSIKLPTNN